MRKTTSSLNLDQSFFLSTDAFENFVISFTFWNFFSILVGLNSIESLGDPIWICRWLFTHKASFSGPNERCQESRSSFEGVSRKEKAPDQD